MGWVLYISGKEQKTSIVRPNCRQDRSTSGGAGAEGQIPHRCTDTITVLMKNPAVAFPLALSHPVLETDIVTDWHPLIPKPSRRRTVPHFSHFCILAFNSEQTGLYLIFFCTHSFPYFFFLLSNHLYQAKFLPCQLAPRFPLPPTHPSLLIENLKMKHEMKKLG